MQLLKMSMFSLLGLFACSCSTRSTVDKCCRQEAACSRLVHSSAMPCSSWLDICHVHAENLWST